MIDPLTALGVAAAAFATSVVGGIAGYGTNLLMPIALAPVVGAAAAIPILAVSGMFNNASRLVVFRDKVEWRPVLPLTLAAMPSCLVGAWLFTLLSGPQVALLVGLTLIATVPLRRWLKGRRLRVGPVGIVLLGIVFGLVTGGTPGGGVLLTAALAALGLAPQAVIATDAAISLAIGAVKVLAFQALGELPAPAWLLALGIGLIAIPGVMTARWLSNRLSVALHGSILEVAILAGGAALVHRGLTGA